MVRSGRRGSLALLVIALAVAGACKSKPAASIDEMFTARTQGQLFLQRGQLPEAEAQFLKLVEWAPKEALGFTNLGLVYLQEGRYKEAEKQLERAHELDAGNSDVDLMLAKLYSLTGRVGEAVKTLEAMKPNGPNETRRLHALADLAGQSHTRADSLRREALLTQIVALKPANIVVRLELAAVAVRRGVVDSTLRQLEDIRRIPPGPPKDVVPLLEATIQQLRTGTPAAAQSAFDRFREAMEVTAQYQVALQEVTWIEAPLAGRAALAFEPQSLITFLGSGFNKERTTLVKFVDFTSDAGLPEPRAAAAGTLASPTSLALGDINGDGYDEVLAGSRLFHLQRGYASDMTAHDSLGTFANVAVAAFGDFDNDGWTDLFLIADGKGRLLRNSGAGTFVDATPKAGFDVQGATKAVWVDLDHDGDLDLVLVGNGRRLVYRNNMDGTFTESAAAMGITGTGDARSLVFGDFDGDGRIDLFLTNATGSDVLYRNAGGRTMTDATAASGLTTTGGSGAAAVGDYDNDGLLDLFVSRVDGGEPTLWHNKGDGTFTRDVRSTNALRKLRGVVGRGAEFVDIDNDGWLDLVVAGTPTKAGERGVFLFHNDGTGTFTDQSALLPASLMSATSVATSDVDGDGDEDLLFGVDGGVRLLRNEGGNGRMSTRIQLFALKSGSGKNNSF
ncbi:MAG: FG-GAP-like repeat-containing protein, partial [bacterium]